jgi:hypothetical protein
VVTHLTTNPPVRCLNRAERTGSLVLNVLWSNVKVLVDGNEYQVTNSLVVTCLTTSLSVLCFSILKRAVTFSVFCAMLLRTHDSTVS